MSEKKHIDRVFQESFKDFEAQPSDAVWQNIEAQLNGKKKKRRIIPIWWRYAGAAALLLLFLTVGNLLFEDTNPNPLNGTENVVDDDIKKVLPTIENSESISNQNKTSTTPENETLVSGNEASSVSVSASNTNAVAKTSTPKNNKNNQTNIASNQVSGKHIATIQTNKDNTTVKLSEDKKANTTPYGNNDSNPTLASSNNNGSTLSNKENAQNSVNTASEKNNTAVAKTENKEQNDALSIEEAIDKNKDLLENEISNQQNRWSIAPNAAPVYFNTLGEGSSIDPQFNNNSKTGEVNMSYGISASYAVNKKLKIRSGVNKVNLGYNTNDIVVYQSVGLSSNSNALQNVNSGGASAGYSVVSSKALNAKDLPQTLLTSNTTINQAFGYIEVPLEVQYTLSDKKFGVNVIGGFSSFFLDNNEVYSRAENGPMVFLGEARNINKVSYSANLGLGLNYQISKTFDLNLEPMFKYQFNTFNNTSGNFTPFFIGVYTGFAIKF
ncbi:hypothetical protein [Tamlana crocina]|uniref:Outer membrane protein beta-barrel domain-containing protein n=1 Tax=Tamlana crocina TaxID=393006 RepID=A0ABX1DAM4_9FLAO|nr:hypothetical protein [Tamlana crocina]NJX14088.1 hypothetical protein [Tamlana crocina]